MKFRIIPLLLFVIMLVGCFHVEDEDAGAVGRVNYLDGVWLAQQIDKVNATGETISSTGFVPTNWINAEVPGTILPALVGAGIYPDPYIGVNNIDSTSGVSLPVYIPDLWDKYHIGDTSFYTYWYYTPFSLPALKPDQHAWLNFRGVNYAADMYVNGENIAANQQSMFLRHTLDITAVASQSNKLAVQVRPSQPLNPGTFNHSGNGGLPDQSWLAVANKYPVGWDWISPIRDRNVGIWDRVSTKITGPVVIGNPHITTTFSSADLSNATINMSIEVYNASTELQAGELIVNSEKGAFAQKADFSVPPGDTAIVSFPVTSLANPEVWWPNGYGEQPIYDATFKATLADGQQSDQAEATFGIREVDVTFATYHQESGVTVAVNGQKIFIRGGNWIATDGMLRYNRQRYDDEVRFHRDMNLNMIRVWGGGIVERPEFYEACDKYGLLVMQDFWMSGEHDFQMPVDLYLESVRDRIKMLRNHPSLCFWSGGNEMAPPVDVINSSRCYIEGGSSCSGQPLLDGTRTFIDCSTCVQNSYPSSQDGPYGIRKLKDLYSGNYSTAKATAFNPEVGSVGVVTTESMSQMMGHDTTYLSLPPYKSGKTANDGWREHKYQGYLWVEQPGDTLDFIDHYGVPSDYQTFCDQAQIVNYNQYRALMEGYNIRMWDYNSGAIIWRTQSSWPNLRSQVYDWYLEQTGAYFGIQHGAEHIHVQYNMATTEVGVVNNSPEPVNVQQINITLMDLLGQGEVKMLQYAGPASANSYTPTGEMVPQPSSFNGVYYMKMEMIYTQNNITDTIDNFYWLSENDTYTGIRANNVIPVMETSNTLEDGTYKYTVTLTNTGNKVSFWNRLQILNQNSRNRILPVFYSDNYVSLFPGESKVILLEFAADQVAEGDSPYINLIGY